MADPALAELQRRLAAGAEALSPRGLRPMWDEVADDAEAQVQRAVRSDLGDLSMSGWYKGRPVIVAARATVPADGVELAPAPGAGGAFKVLEQGRQGGKHGTTRGRRTWSKATDLVANSAPKIAEQQIGTILERAVTGG